MLEAMSLGKPVIATAFGGCLEFMTPDNSYLLDCQRTPVCGMPWYKPYRGDQMWAEPDLAQLRRILRHVYQEPREARCKGQRAAQDARAFSWGRVGEQVREILVSGRNPSGNAGQFVSKKLPPMPCATALPA